MVSLAEDSIVLTGCGWLTPNAAGGITEILHAAKESETRIEPPTASGDPGQDSAPGSGYWAVPDEKVQDYPNLAKELRRDKGAWLTAVAFELARDDASLSLASLDTARLGLALGCGLAGQIGMLAFANEVRQQTPRFVSPIHFPQTVGNYIAGALARAYDIRGPNLTLASGAASGVDAIVEGCTFITSGRADIVLAGGTEPLTEALAGGFGPSDIRLSEGACLFVLETSRHASERGVQPLAIVTGWDNPPDRPTGAGACVSVAGFVEPGAICIEKWVGRCIGASGACAVAAAIGAAKGCEVPIVDSTNPMSVTISSLPQQSMPTGGGAVSVTVQATNVDGGCSVLELSIPVAD